MCLFIRISILISFIFLTVSHFGCSSASRGENVNVEQKPVSTPPAITDRPKIIAYGDSLTYGYGLDSWELSYPGRLQLSVDDAGFDYQVINAGFNGDTTETGLNRLWLTLGISNIKVFILALGANDVVKKVPAEQMKRHLSEILKQIKAKNIQVVLCGIYPPDKFGPEYSAEINEMFRNLGRDFGVVLLPSLMQDVSGNPDRMLPDAIHPNEQGTKAIERNVWAVLRPLLEKKLKPKGK